MDIVNILENIFSTPKKRLLIILFVPLLLNILFFSFIIRFTYNRFDFPEEENKTLQAQIQQFTVDDFIGGLGFITKIPSIFLNFNVFTRNKIIFNEGNKIVVGSLNIKYLDRDTYGIKIFTIKEIYSSVNIKTILSRTPFQRSIDLYNDTEKPLSSNYENYEPYYSIFVLPTLFSFIILYVAWIFVIYGLLILSNIVLKFILVGYPVTETLEEYKKYRIK